MCVSSIDKGAKSIALQNVTLDSSLWSFAEFGTDFNGCMSNLIINDEVAPFKVNTDAFSGSCRASKLTRDADENEYISTTEAFNEEETTTSFDEEETTTSINDANDVVSDQGWYFMPISHY